VFASHSDEFLVELCDTAIWMDAGEIKEQGSLREVVSAYKGRDLFDSLSPETMRRLHLQGDAAAAAGSGEPTDETVGLP
jgi:ABC-2 type transport system ATP-binding protein